MVIDLAGSGESQFLIKGEGRGVLRIHFKLDCICILEELIEGKAEHLSSHTLVPAFMDDPYPVNHPHPLFHGRIKNPNRFVLIAIQKYFSVCA